MPSYNDLRPDSDYDLRDYALVFPNMTGSEKLRTIANLLRLKEGMAKEIPPKRAEESLLIATWNIKEFGHTTQRLNEAYFYIAEIISNFDLVAIQEVKSTLKDLDLIMRILGDDWAYIVNDITEGDEGNSERSAYVFNKNRVELSGLAGEIVLWNDLTADSEIKQLKRTPYMTGFRAGWKSFALVNLHLHPGDDAEDIEYRKEEVALFLRALEEKGDDLWTQNLILTGDFNLYKRRDDETVALIGDHSYAEVDGLLGKNTNAAQTQAFDRIFIKKNDYFRLAVTLDGVEVADVFDPFGFVYLEEEHLQYKEAMLDVYGGSKDLDNDVQALKSYFLHYWRRNQISDHLPIWFELIIDSSVSFLELKHDQIKNN